MKRFGLRALASTLATLMVVSAFGPAKAASAADDILLIAPNPNALKTLYITEDMVDEDGEIVISGGSYDRVVVSKEVAAKDIYFDQVTVGEMVVESGGDSRIQLWEVDAEQVTVQEPELEALKLSDLKDLLADQETRAAALQMYIESLAKDEKTKKTAPTIVTKEDAAVDSFVARANVTLDLADGEVGAVALEGSEKVDRAKVTLKNYKGDVSFKGSEGKSNMTLNNVDSRINTLKVEESDADDYFMVNAKNSVVIKAEVGGNANLSLNALTGALEVTEEATAANVTLLNTIEEMNIAGNGATVEVAPCARVEMMAVAGNDAKVTGSGTLVEADITGKGAYVSTYGSKVKGENTYVPPVYVAPAVPKVEFTDIDLVADDGAEVVKNANGSATINFSGQYNKAYFNVPSSVDINRVSKVIMNITAPGNFGLKIHTTEGVDITSNSWFPNGNGSAADYSYDVNPARQKIAKLEFMSTSAGSSFTVNSITFELLDEAPEVEEKPLVTENKTYTFKDMTIDWTNPDVTQTIDANGAMTLSFNGNYKGIVCRFPQPIDPVDYPEMVFNAVSPNQQIGFKIWQIGETGDNPKICAWGNQPETATDIKVDISNATALIEKIEIISMEPTARFSATVNSITVIGSGNVGNTDDDNGGNTTPVIPAAPSTLPDTYGPVWTGHLLYATGGMICGDGCKAECLDYHNATKVAFSGQYNEIKLQLPAAISIADYEKMIVTVSSTTDALAVKAYGNSTELKAWYDNTATETKDLEFNLSDLGTSEGSIDTVGIMANNAACEFIFYRVAFVPSGESGGPTGPVIPEGGTQCTPIVGSAVMLFDSEDLRSYAGSTVEINVSVCKTGDAEIAVHLQTNEKYVGVAGDNSWTKPITTEWTTYKSYFPVPGDWASHANPIHFGLLMCRADEGRGDLLYDYDACDYYYKDFYIREVETAEERTYTFDELVSYHSTESTSKEVDGNGALSVTFSDQYKTVQYNMPTDINTKDYIKMVFNVSTPDGQLCIKCWQLGETSKDGNSKIITYVNPTASTVDVEVDISGATDVIEKVDFMSTNPVSAFPYTSVVNSITFK